MLETVGRLTDPIAYGRSAEDASISCSVPAGLQPSQASRSRSAGTWPGRHRPGPTDAPTGYTRYVAQAGDVGAEVTDAIDAGVRGSGQDPANLLVPRLTVPCRLTATRTRRGTQIAPSGGPNGYFVEIGHPTTTIGYALLDSPVALAASMSDHDADAYHEITHAFVDEQPSATCARDHILDDVTLFWLTGAGASAATSYSKAYGPDAPAAGRQPLPPPTIPFGFTAFPGEIWPTPRGWVEASYPNVILFHDQPAATSPPGRARALSSELRRHSGHYADRPTSFARATVRANHASTTHGSKLIASRRQRPRSPSLDGESPARQPRPARRRRTQLSSRATLVGVSLKSHS